MISIILYLSCHGEDYRGAVQRNSTWSYVASDVLVGLNVQELARLHVPLQQKSCFKLCLRLQASLCERPIPALSAQSDMGGSSPSSLHGQDMALQPTRREGMQAPLSLGDSL